MNLDFVSGDGESSSEDKEEDDTEVDLGCFSEILSEISNKGMFNINLPWWFSVIIVVIEATDRMKYICGKKL